MTFRCWDLRSAKGSVSDSVGPPMTKPVIGARCSTTVIKLSVFLLMTVLLGVKLRAEDGAIGDNQMSQKNDSTRVLFDFVHETEAESWLVVTDNVMGGVSRGTMIVSEDSCLVFSGTLSVENNGGFASIRTLPKDFGVGDYKGLRIRVRGDGRVYQFRLRLDDNFDGIAFTREFQTTKNRWLEIDLPFASFVPTYRGRILRNVKPLIAADIRQLGFLLGDKTAGQFKLIVDNIAVFR
jgi:NADH dehydrogenase [ubiquinone] 1 alpha subcomplex assembly factor 1